eukprot:872016-Prymnesium_polylepis.1
MENEVEIAKVAPARKNPARYARGSQKTRTFTPMLQLHTLITFIRAVLVWRTLCLSWLRGDTSAGVQVTMCKAWVT